MDRGRAARALIAIACALAVALAFEALLASKSLAIAVAFSGALALLMIAEVFYALDARIPGGKAFLAAIAVAPLVGALGWAHVLALLAAIMPLALPSIIDARVRVEGRREPVLALFLATVMLCAGFPWCLAVYPFFTLSCDVSSYAERRKALGAALAFTLGGLAVALAFKSMTTMALITAAPAAWLAVGAVKASKPELLRIKRNIRYGVPRELKAFVVADLITSAAFMVNAVIGSLMILTATSTSLLLSGAMLVAYGLVGGAVFLWRALTVGPELAVYPFKNRWYTAFIVHRPRLDSLARWYAEKLRDLVERAAALENPYMLACKHLTAAIIALLVAPALAPLALFNPFMGLMAVAVVIIVALAILASPMLVLHSKVGDRKRRTEQELPWLLILAACLEAAGVPLYEALRSLKGKGLLKWMEREAKLLEKKMSIEGMDPLSALADIARKHPSRRFSEILRGYLSIYNTGGDLYLYLKNQAFGALRDLKAELERLSNRSAFALELGIVAIIIPLSAIAIMAIVLPTWCSAFTAIAPFIAMLIALGMNSLAPPRWDDFSFNHFMPATFTALAAAWVLLTRPHGWLAVATVFLAMGLGYGVQFVVQDKVVKEHERGLVRFLEDIAERRRTGMLPSRAIASLWEEGVRYNPYFDKVFEALARMVSWGIPLNEAIERVYSPSWLTRYALFILGEIERSGGGTPETLQMLYEFVDHYTWSMKQVKTATRVASFMVYGAPLMLAFTIAFVASMARMFSGMNVSMAGVHIGMNVDVEMIENMAKLATASAVIALSMAVAKAKDLTFKSLIHVAIVTIVLILAFGPLYPLLSLVK